MATWRVHVKAPDAAAIDPFKNEVSRFKKLYSHGGAEAIFEFPESNEKGADEMVAEENDHIARIERLLGSKSCTATS